MNLVVELRPAAAQQLASLLADLGQGQWSSAAGQRSCAGGTGS
jgi:hypothetical protein